MSVSEWLVRLGNGIKKNLPNILTGTGITLMIGGTVDAVRSTPEALRRIEEKKEEEGHTRLTMAQTIQATWKCYIRALILETAGAGCLIGAQTESNKRNAALALACNSAELGLREFAEYRRYVAERIGEDKEREIHNQATQEMVRQNPPPATMQPEFVDGVAPKPICCYIAFERYFYADYDTVKAAINKLNTRITGSIGGFVSLNDFFYEIGVKGVKEGDKLGWNTEIGLLEIPEKEFIEYSGTPNGWPCWILEFVNPPRYEYNYFRHG